MRAAAGSASWTAFHSRISALVGRYIIEETARNAIRSPIVRPHQWLTTANRPRKNPPTADAWLTSSTTERESTRLRTTLSERRKYSMASRR